AVLRFAQPLRERRSTGVAFGQASHPPLRDESEGRMLREWRSNRQTAVFGLAPPPGAGRSIWRCLRPPPPPPPPPPAGPAGVGAERRMLVDSRRVGNQRFYAGVALPFARAFPFLGPHPPLLPGGHSCARPDGLDAVGSLEPFLFFRQHSGRGVARSRHLRVRP